MSGPAALTEHIDPASDRSVYKQIADHLRQAIARGRLREGEQLPSETRLIEHYGVARMTVRNALRILQDEGLTTAEHGRGVYVRARPPVRRLASDRFARSTAKRARPRSSRRPRRPPPPDVDEITVTRHGRRPRCPDRLALDDDDQTVTRTRRSCRRPADRARGLVPPGRSRTRHTDRRPEPWPGRDLRPTGGRRAHAGSVYRGGLPPDADSGRGPDVGPGSGRAGVPAGPYGFRQHRPRGGGLRHDYGCGRLSAVLRPACALGP